jgi:hypothetical protein
MLPKSVDIQHQKEVELFMTFEELFERGTFSFPSIDVLIDLIYYTNEYSVPKHLAVFGKPKELDQRPLVEDDPNTFIGLTLDETYDKRFLGNDGFMYRRFELSRLIPNSESPVMVPGAPFKVHDIITSINTALGVLLSEQDLMNDEYSEVPDTLTLRASPDSYVWIGNSLEIALTDLSETTYPIRVTEDDRPRLTEDSVERTIEEFV